ncbi:5'-nucleotidase, lipoprotein e(P4) family [Aequorivita echinoideorum]|uniref:5'-nucleotidase, lipoprotein e(P4) family n=1 Tax=Aequorivita echinoideorum TaxID=1549647 RepID=A0ABS5S5M9_9FLAO|nr:HAD family acid phosphatase [Aequorivita echinoideorum]MBT0608528.1 hypothetical protein [Aequorivita echinoideorum]
MKSILYSLFIAIFFLASCGTTKEKANSSLHSHENLNATLWMQTSVEYKMLCEQIYKLATTQMLENLNDKSISAALEQSENFINLPPAVIVDVDETILDNSPFEARSIKNGAGYTDTAWKSWVNEKKAKPISGAKDFVETAKENGITVFYVSNRELKDPTLENLQKEIDPNILAENILLKNEKPEWTSDKTSRRKLISEKYRIILLVGDDYNDFVFLGKENPVQRKQLAEEQMKNWGKNWIILPNPTYGSFENALLDYRHDRNEAEQFFKKLEYLNTSE